MSDEDIVDIGNVEGDKYYCDIYVGEAHPIEVPYYQTDEEVYEVIKRLAERVKPLMEK